MSVRNEIKAQIVRAGFTMQEAVDLLHDEYGWSDSVSNLSAKLHRDYEDAVAVLDRIPKEVLAAYTHRTEKERETAYGR